MRVISCAQGTAEWLQARNGRIGASRIRDVMAKPKRGRTEELACRRDYRMELLCERLTGRAAEHYVSREMEHGMEFESHARAAYEIGEDALIEEVGLVIHPTMDFTSASPDGLVGDEGCIEIKCPKTSTHLGWKIADVVPEEHILQMQWVMNCCGRDWADFISLDPRLPQGLRFFVKRLMRDEVLIAEMEMEVRKFHAEVEYMRMELGALPWQPIMPSNQEMVSVGDLSIPKDLSDMLDAAEIIP